MLENCRMMDMNHDSLVDLNEFLEAFRLCQQFKQPPSHNNNNANGTSEKLQKPMDNPKSTIVITPEKNEVEQENHNHNNEQDKVDEYEFSEMKESLNPGGELRKSPSVKSVVSVDSLNRTGKLKDDGNSSATMKERDKRDFDNIIWDIDQKEQEQLIWAVEEKTFYLSSISDDSKRVSQKTDTNRFYLRVYIKQKTF